MIDSPAGEPNADYEAALGQLCALIGERVLVTWHSGGEVIGSTGGELIDAVPLRAGSDAEAMMFRLGGAIFMLDRETFRGWRLHLGDDGLDGLDLLLAGGAEVKLTTFAAIGLA